MSSRNEQICPVEKANSLDTRFRRWFQNPNKILKPYISKGMTVLDLGCGPGFFTVALAQMVGTNGKVIAVDLQEGMLQRLYKKIKGTELENRITLHKCEKDELRILESVDFVLAFYVVHEISDQQKLFAELATILKPAGELFLVEPPFHVSKKAFAETIKKAIAAGFTEVKRPKVTFNKTVFLKNNQMNYWCEK
jgi:ubiquinone/menaquinone biosynthesis C-methylase UbiE